MAQEIIISGFGGQGVMSMGQLLTYAGMLDGKNVSWLPSYGPEMRGGTANCSVILADDMIGSPIVTEATALIAMNLPSLEKFEQARSRGLLIVNSLNKSDDIDAYYVPANEIADQLGNSGSQYGNARCILGENPGGFLRFCYEIFEGSFRSIQRTLNSNKPKGSRKRCPAGNFYTSACLTNL